MLLSVMTARAALISLGLCFCTGVCAEDRIGEIDFTGNEVTQEKVLLREMLIHPGDEVDLDRIDRSLQNIRDLGLYNSVEYYLEQDSPDSDIKLVVDVTEKYFFFVIPTAKTNDNNQLEYGAKMIWYNVFGMNHTLKWKLLDAGSKASVKQYKNELNYVAPDIFDSQYRLALSLNKNRFVDEDPLFGLQSEDNEAVSVDVVRWFNADGLSKGVYAGIGLEYRSRDIEAISASAVSQGFFKVSALRLLTGYVDVKEHAYSREGLSVSYTARMASDATGPTGAEFLLQDIDLRQYISLSVNPPRSINYHLGIGTSTNDILGDKAFNLGGNSTLRGYEIGTFRGNTQLYGSIEYLSMLHDDPFLRKVFFADFGETVPNLSDINLGHLNLAVGAGIRWKIRQFVHFNLRVDLAYGFDTDAYRIAIGAKHAF